VLLLPYYLCITYTIFSETDYNSPRLMLAEGTHYK